jgi:MFS family permease
VIGVACLVALGFVERRAAEPILPPSLFGNRVFVVTSAVALVVGFALFGALTYLPLFQQIVRGLSPTASGLQLLPVMGGLLVSSIVSGQVISRVGRYKLFPIAGTLVAAIGMFLLSSLSESTGTGVAALHMLVLGLGLGMVMQVLVLAVQNAVPYAMLGVATSGATLFRSIGGSLGTAVLGAIFTGRLTSDLPAGAASGGGLDPAAIQRLPAAQRDVFLSAFTDALQLVFTVATGVVLVAFLLSWLIPERPLRRTVETTVGDVMGCPVDTDSMREATRALSIAVGRERTLRFLAATVARAGVELSPSASWTLLRLGAPDAPTLDELATRPHVDPARLLLAAGELRDRGLLEGERPTEAGRVLRERLVAARTDGFRALVAEWEPDQNPELDPLLRRLASELAAPA